LLGSTWRYGEGTEKDCLLKKIQEKIEYRQNALEEMELSPDQANQSSVFHGARGLGNAINTTGRMAAKLAGNDAADQVFMLDSLALFFINFFRIPFIYLTAYWSGKKVPLTLSNNTRWAYSAILLGLAITALAAPVTAPVIAFVSAGFALVGSAIYLRNILLERQKLSREIKLLDLTLVVEERNMLGIQEQAKILEERLNGACDDKSIRDVCNHITELGKQYEAQKIKIQDLYNKQALYQQLMNEFNFKKIDKAVSVFMASATVIGLVVSLFFPPAGLVILATVAFASTTYIVGRASAPLFQSLNRWITGKEPLNAAYQILNNEDERDRNEEKNSLAPINNSPPLSAKSIVSRHTEDSTSIVYACLENARHPSSIEADKKEEPVPPITVKNPIHQSEVVIAPQKDSDESEKEQLVPD
jgi:hypothetical protein